MNSHKNQLWWSQAGIVFIFSTKKRTKQGLVFFACLPYVSDLSYIHGGQVSCCHLVGLSQWQGLKVLQGRRTAVVFMFHDPWLIEPGEIWDDDDRILHPSKGIDKMELWPCLFWGCQQLHTSSGIILSSQINPPLNSVNPKHPNKTPLNNVRQHPPDILMFHYHEFLSKLPPVISNSGNSKRILRPKDQLTPLEVLEAHVPTSFVSVCI